ncbi:hypothetical protein [Massilia sp. DWR3-1-1]|uniref:hypothetical protein n=1 Tax=Massilia sp. DWR3-1-1 TaxID=2804559 RepID=UPI003CF289AD
MPYRTIPGTKHPYFLIAVDEAGVERSADPDADAAHGLISEQFLAALAEQDISDLFIWSHGWKGDVMGAFDQYDRWIGAFHARTGDRAQMRAQRPAFRDMHLGFHWPSQPWGDESLVAGNSFAPGAGAQVDALTLSHAQVLGDSPAVRAALRALFEEVRTHAGATAMTAAASQAYLDLNEALALGQGGAAGDGSADRPPFDPASSTAGDAIASFGVGAIGQVLLAPLRQLTFWTMKKRARTVGENGLHSLLLKIGQTCPAVRVHLIGHSFGCIVMSSAIQAGGAAPRLPRAVDSCVLLQGATSLWAFSARNQYQGDVAGYFNPVIAGRLVSGPLVTTRSTFDYALGKIYPWAAGLAGQISFGPPQYGAIGIHGICGIDDAVELPMKDAAAPYQLQPGRVYNVDGSAYICQIDGVSGAHSDIGGPEVAHLIWQAALPAAGAP